MFLSSHAVAYFSSVVMFMTVPALMGISTSPAVLPVRISGPLVSRAMASGLPGCVFSASRALSMTDWWYSYEPWEKFMRTTLRPTLRRALIFSAELVLGPMVQMMEVLRYCLAGVYSVLSW